jgi:hypothetical protein
MIRSTLTTLCFLVGAGAVTLLACSSDEVTEKYPSSDSFCAAKADTECQPGAPVCGVTVDVCKSKRTSLCQAAASAATGQGGTYRPQNAETCINDTKTLYDSKVVDLDKEKTVDATCALVFAGSKTKGAACAAAFECDAALICDRGFCSEKTPKAKDEPCNNPGDTCATGTYCGPRGASNFCNAKNNVGDICNTTTPCLENLRCVNQCQEKLGSGQSCNTNDDCTTGFCGTDKKCAAKLVPGPNGCADFGS